MKFYSKICVGATQTISLSVLARNPHKGPEDEISHQTGSGGEKEGLRGDRESSLQRKAAKNSRLEIAVQRGRHSQQEEAVRRWRQGRKESQQKSERRLLRPVDLQRSG